MEAAKREAEAAGRKSEEQVQQEIAALKANAAAKESEAIEAVLANLY